MSEYTDFSSLAISPVTLPDGRGAYKLYHDLVWELGYHGSGLFVTVPKGFITDLASVPPMLTPIMNGFAPEFAKASAVHDWLRPSRLDIIQQERPEWDVQSAAGEFYHCLKADKVTKWKRKAAYFAVVWFGTQKEDW